MGRPTAEELDTALREAARMREAGEDPHLLAKSLLNLNYRVRYLEDVMHKADLYLHSRAGALEHADLVTAIARARTVSAAAGGDDEHLHPW